MSTAALAIIVVSSICIYLADSAINTLGTQKSCRTNEYFQDANEAVLLADNIFCSKECPCDGNDDFESRTQYNYTDGYAKNVQSCGLCNSKNKAMQLACEGSDYSGIHVDKYFSQEQRKSFEFLKWMEENFNCSGMCSKARKYLFSDVNAGDPHGSCRKELRKWIDETIRQTSIYILLMGIYLALNVVLVCCMMCCPLRKSSSRSTCIKY